MTSTPEALRLLPDLLDHLDGRRVIAVDAEGIGLKVDLGSVRGDHLSLQGHL